MPSVLSSLRPHSVLGVAGLALSFYIVYSKRSMRKLDPARDWNHSHSPFTPLASSSSPNSTDINGKSTKQHSSSSSLRVGVNARFLKQINKLLPIMIPGIASKETGLLTALCVILFARTWLDVWFSALNSTVVKAIVSRNRPAFLAYAVSEFGAMMWVLSITNNSLKLVISNISLAFRSRLSRAAHDRYLNGIAFYTASTIDQRLQNIDQLLTQDIDKLCDSASHLLADTLKPLVDIIIFGYKLGQAIGKEAPLFMIGYFVFSAFVLRSLSSPFGRYTAESAKLEGDFRFTHSRIIAHAEEVAFYGGGDREKKLVNSAFDRIVRHASRIFKLRFANGIIDSVFVKYLATMLAYFLLARPVFNPSRASPLMGGSSVDPTKIMSDYSRNSSYLVNLSQAVGRVILAGRDLTRFAGYTSRVAELFEVLEDINKGRYEATMVGSSGEISAATSNAIPATDLKGVVDIVDDRIEFDRVPIITPNGDCLVKEISFKVETGQNTLITGPNGCGKSSLFRILGDLWPFFGGRVAKPRPERLFYVPQKPYLALGTLRDQITYPQTREQAFASGLDDDKLLELLRVVRLEYLVHREGGFDAVQDWASALSGGEKQRVAMARLFHTNPTFAILDECTSAVSVDVEGEMYTYARNVGITLFTVSHRTSLFKYHDFLLRFDGEGGYEFTKLDHSKGEINPFAFGHGKSKYGKSSNAPSESPQLDSLHSLSSSSSDD